MVTRFPTLLMTAPEKSERVLIQADIDLFRQRNSWRAKATKNLIKYFIGWGFFSMLVGVLLTEYVLK